jgi:hypothetical protein
MLVAAKSYVKLRGAARVRCAKYYREHVLFHMMSQRKGRKSSIFLGQG